MKNRLLALLLTAALLLLPAWAHAQGDPACAMDTALMAALMNCGELPTGQVCYGYPVVEAALNGAAAGGAFAAPGDRVPARAITDLTLRADEPGTWGVVRAAVQADLPEGQTALLAAFGDVHLTTGEPVPPHFGVGVAGTVNVRAEPSIRADIVGQITPGQSVVTDGRLADSSWLRVQWEGSYAWLFANLARPMGDVAELDVVDPAEPLIFYGPLQAFYLSTGPAAPACESAPPGGLLFQTPAGLSASLLVNEVMVRVAGTAAIQSADALRVCALEGWASVQAWDVARLAWAGSCVDVPLSSRGRAPLVPPEAAGAYEAAAAAALPVVALSRLVDPAPPLPQDALDALAADLPAGEWQAEYAMAALRCEGGFGGPVDMSAEDGPVQVSFAPGGAALTLSRGRHDVRAFTRTGPDTFATADGPGAVMLRIAGAGRLEGLLVQEFPGECTIEAPFVLAAGG